jgi:hypothetical protein
MRPGSRTDRFWTCIVDEMNLARVEQYFAEVLSLIEDRHPAPGGGFASQPLLSRLPREEDTEWAAVNLPPNLALIGTVNMDETTHGFSRKVLDRAFTLELSDIDLTLWAEAAPVTHDRPAWPVSVWYPRATSLAGLRGAGGGGAAADRHRDPRLNGRESVPHWRAATGGLPDPGRDRSVRPSRARAARIPSWTVKGARSIRSTWRCK